MRFRGGYLGVCKYNSSTFFLAHSVFLKNLRLDLMLGSLLKQFIFITLPKRSQPWYSTRCVNIASRVLPWSGLLGCCIIAKINKHTGARQSFALSTRFIKSSLPGRI